MFKRIAQASAVALLIGLVPGCVELNQTITLNPDGKGKVQYEIITADLGGTFKGIAGGIGGPGGKEEKERSPAELLHDFLEKQITSSKGVAAWKDVSAKWTKDGRIQFNGTAYFERLDDISSTPAPDKGQPGLGGPAMGGPSWGGFLVQVDKDTIRISGKKDAAANLNPGPPNPKPMAFDPAKATPQEWDDFVLKSRIAYQQTKPLFTMMLADLKVKTTFHVPGEVKESKGFKKEANGAFVNNLEGDAVLAGMKKMLLQDVADWKKIMAAADPKKPIDPSTALQMLGFSPDMFEPSMTVHKLGKAQFDWQKEVQDARANYPRMREQLKLNPNSKLPGEN